MQDPIVILGKDLEEIVRADEANTRVRQRDNGHLAMHCSDLKDFLSKHRQRSRLPHFVSLLVYPIGVSVHEVLQDCDVCFEPVLAPPKVEIVSTWILLKSAYIFILRILNLKRG